MPYLTCNAIKTCLDEICKAKYIATVSWFTSEQQTVENLFSWHQCKIKPSTSVHLLWIMALNFFCIVRVIY